MNEVRAYEGKNDGGCTCCRERENITVLEFRFSSTHPSVAGTDMVGDVICSVNLCPTHLAEAMVTIDHRLDNI
jgi:hypothetical protein